MFSKERYLQVREPDLVLDGEGKEYLEGLETLLENLEEMSGSSILAIEDFSTETNNDEHIFLAVNFEDFLEEERPTPILENPDYYLPGEAVIRVYRLSEKVFVIEESEPGIVNFALVVMY
jgi:hypothetical protein